MDSEQIIILKGEIARLTESEKELKEKWNKAKEAALSFVLLAGENYRQSFRSNLSRLEQKIKAVIYRDLVLMYARIFKQEIHMNDELLEDAKSADDISSWVKAGF
jgi:hypothetical protein